MTDILHEQCEFVWVEGRPNVESSNVEIAVMALDDLSIRMQVWSERFTGPCDLSRELRGLAADWSALAEQMRGPTPIRVQPQQ